MESCIVPNIPKVMWTEGRRLDNPRLRRLLQRGGARNGRGAQAALPAPSLSPCRDAARLHPLHEVPRSPHLHGLGCRWPDLWPLRERRLHQVARMIACSALPRCDMCSKTHFNLLANQFRGDFIRCRAKDCCPRLGLLLDAVHRCRPAQTHEIAVEDWHAIGGRIAPAAPHPSLIGCDLTRYFRSICHFRPSSLRRPTV